MSLEKYLIKGSVTIIILTLFFSFCRGVFLSIFYFDLKYFILDIIYYSLISFGQFANVYFISIILIFGIIFFICTYYFKLLKNFYFVLFYFVLIYLILFLKTFILFINKETNIVDYEDFYIPLICLIPSSIFYYFILKKYLWQIK